MCVSTFLVVVRIYRFLMATNLLLLLLLLLLVGNVVAGGAVRTVSKLAARIVE